MRQQQNTTSKLLKRFNSSLNPLRKAKRELGYSLFDVYRTIAKRQQLSEIINQKEIRFIGLRRSGNHALISWIKAQEKNCYFLNTILAGMSPFRQKHLHFPNKGFRDEAWGNFKPKECFIYSYEDHSLAQITKPEYEKKHDLYIGKTKTRYDVLLLRDPFNLIASRFKKGYLDVRSPDISLADMWIEYAREFVGETEYLTHNKVVINYNQWFSDTNYRQAIADKLDIDFSDAGINYVSSYGGGSSFEAQDLSGNAQDMKVLKRWEAFSDNSEFRALLNNKTLLHYSDKIFGIIPGTEAIRD